MDQPVRTFSVMQYMTSIRNKLAETPAVWVHGVITRLTEKCKVVYISIADFEEGNVKPLVEAIVNAFCPERIPCEVVLVNDGSSDNTAQALSALTTDESLQLPPDHAPFSLVAINLSRNFGKESALFAGMEAASGEDAFAAFAASLAGQERAWLDAVLVEVGKTQSSTLSATDIMQDFVRSFWEAHLKQVRGTLPAVGDDEANKERMKITMDLKRLKQVRWAVVKDMIRDFRRE